MAVKLGNGNWAVKENKLLAYNDNSGRFFNKEFDFARGSSATYVGKDGLIKSAASGVPRIDFSDSSSGALLLEPQSTNLLTYSESFNQWSLTGATIASNALISPDGTLNADKLVESTSSTQHRINFTTTSSSGNNTFSVFAKKGEREFLWVRIGLSSGYFNLNNGFSSDGTGIIASSIDYGNGWYKCIINKANSVANEVCRINITDNFGGGDYQGDGTSGAYIWGAQYEQSSFATSYIPSLSGSATTRSADACNNVGNEQAINSQSGALFGEFKTDPDGGNFLISISENNNNGGAVFIGADANEKIYTYYNSANHVSDINSYDSFNKVCISWSSDGVKIYINGLSKTVLGSQALSTSNYNNIKFSRANTSLKFLGQIKHLQVFTTALTDEQLAALTTI